MLRTRVRFKSQKTKIKYFNARAKVPVTTQTSDSKLIDSCQPNQYSTLPAPKSPYVRQSLSLKNSMSTSPYAAPAAISQLLLASLVANLICRCGRSALLEPTDTIADLPVSVAGDSTVTNRADPSDVIYHESPTKGKQILPTTASDCGTPRSLEFQGNSKNRILYNLLSILSILRDSQNSNPYTSQPLPKPCKNYQSSLYFPSTSFFPSLNYLS